MGLPWKKRHRVNLKYNYFPGRGPQRLAHLYADEYVPFGYASAGEFANYTKFSIVRHPYDRAISGYNFRHHPNIRFSVYLGQLLRRRSLKRQTFLQFMNQDCENEYLDITRFLIPQTRYLTGPKGELLVDYFLKFETLPQEIPGFFERVFGEARALPHQNKTPGTPLMSTDQLTTEHKDFLFAKYRSDFDYFGYEP